MKNTAHTAPAGFNPPTQSLAPDISRGDQGAKGWTWVLFVLAFIACQQTIERSPTLIGRWQGVEWEINGQPSGIDAAQVEFGFETDGTYMARFGDQSEKGTWYTQGDKLYTTAEGRKEISVRLLKNDGQTLRMEMNRGGRPEELELKKQ
jgi:hypothetical protein